MENLIETHEIDFLHIKGRWVGVDHIEEMRPVIFESKGKFIPAVHYALFGEWDGLEWYEDQTYSTMQEAENNLDAVIGRYNEENLQ